MIRVVQIIPDDRDVFGRYDRDEPFFGPAPTALLEGFSSMCDQVEVHLIACVRKESLPAPAALADNIFYHQILISGGYRRSLFVEVIRAVRKKIEEIQPDVVHGQGTEEYPGLCAAFSGRPNCITIHGNMRAVARKLNYRPFPHMHLAAGLEWLALRKADAVFCNSSYTDACVGRLSKAKPRIFNAVRSSFFELAAHRASHNSQLTVHSAPTLLCVGHILPYKNQIGLINALDSFPRIGNFKLLFAGTCRPEDEYGSAFLGAVAAREWCEYIGRLELPELQKQLNQCSGVIHPTFEDSFGLAVAEAQASGVPVAASAVGGVPDLIRHGETGLLFDPKNPKDIRQKVEDLLDSSLAAKLAKNAHAFASAEYSPHVIARKHIDFYERLIKDHA